MKLNRLSFEDLEQENSELKDANKRYVQYIREKVNQLLKVMGTLPLRPEELDDKSLLDLDPIGIIAGSFVQVLEHLKETNRELSIARDELQAIFDATGVGISIIDRDFRILKCNEKLREMLLGNNEENITGRYCYELYCSKDSPGLDCPAIETMETNRAVILREVQKQNKYFQVVTSPLEDGSGKTIGVIEVLFDITGKKKAEELMGRTEKLVAIGQLSAGVAHELNNPLGNILGYARLLLRDSSLIPEQRERLEIIAEQAKKGNAIIKGLLDFARKSKPSAKDLVKCDLNGIIDSAINILRAESEKRSVKIIKETSPLPSIKVSPGEFEQVLINILLNALQAIVKDGTVWIRAETKEGGIHLEIEDTGPGIPEEIRSRIFDPFFTTKPPGEGTGLGLSICAGIVNEYGGLIDIQSTPGRGSKFIVILKVN